MNKKYIVRLSAEERAGLKHLVSVGKAARKIIHAHVLLLADKLVALKVVDSVSYETVRRVLKKTC